MAICVYCGKEYPENMMTREHVIPQVLGGNIHEKNPFILYNVCRQCNNRAGTFIDGPFAKQFLVKAYIDSNSSSFAEMNNKTTLPLSYMGKIKEYTYEEKICELWLGPCGEAVLHFHNEYNDRLNIPMVGKPTYIRDNEIDHGFVFFYMVSNNPIWQHIAINSVTSSFKNSKIYIGNALYTPNDKLSAIPSHLEELNEKNKETIAASINATFETSFHVHDRFIFKTVLGMAGLFLKTDFLQSEEADLLRRGMWAKSSVDIEDIQISGSSFYKDQELFIDSFLAFDNCHVITLLKVGTFLALNISLFGRMNTTVILTKNLDYLNVNINHMGIVYIIAPSLNRCEGPIDLASFVAHKTGTSSNSKIDKLIADLSKTTELPPRQITSN